MACLRGVCTYTVYRLSLSPLKVFNGCRQWSVCCKSWKLLSSQESQWGLTEVTVSFQFRNNCQTSREYKGPSTAHWLPVWLSSKMFQSPPGWGQLALPASRVLGFTSTTVWTFLHFINNQHQLSLGHIPAKLCFAEQIGWEKPRQWSGTLEEGSPTTNMTLQLGEKRENWLHMISLSSAWKHNYKPLGQ